MSGQGPLAGVRVVEFAAIGPVPYAGMLLADMGADVVRIDRGQQESYPDPVTNRGRSSIVLDLKNPTDLALARAAMREADVVIEGFRPGLRITRSPSRSISTSVRPSKRNALGRRTAWLRPLRKSFAKVMDAALKPKEYTKYISF